MTSHIEKIRALGERMVGNLNAMGVPASFSDGALTLADKILDVPGLVLDTNISWSASSSTVTIGSSVTFTGVLYAYANDISGSNIDFCGIARNVPIKIYKGETLIGTATTNNNGEFTLQHTLSGAGSFSFQAVCEDGENFDGCESTTITVTVSGYDGIEVSAEKPILSYADNDDTDLYAQLVDSNDDPVAVEGVTITFSRVTSQGVVIETLGTAQTDSTGLATLVNGYSSQGIGDVFIGATDGILLIQTFSIQDCIYYHDMTSADNTHWTIPANANASYSSNGMKFSGSGFSDALLNVPLTKPYSIEFDLTEWSNDPSYLHYFWDSTKTTRHLVIGRFGSYTYLDVYPNNSNRYTGNIPQGGHVRIEINEDNAKLYVNDDFKVSKSYTMPSSSILGLAKSSNGTTTWKNIKIKPL